MTEIEKILDESLEDSIEKVDPLELEYGYTVGVRRNGLLYFYVHGEPSVPELSGIQNMAEKKISFMEDTILDTGSAVLRDIRTFLNDSFGCKK